MSETQPMSETLIERLRDRDSVVMSGLFHAIPTMMEAANEIEHLRSELAGCRECRANLDCLSRGAVPVRDDGAERIRELEAALEDALQASNLLLQNSIACVEMHHGLDVQANGLPGWLNDTKAKIERSAALQPKDTAK